MFFFKQKTAYEMRISDWSSDVCSSDLIAPFAQAVPEEPFTHEKLSPVLGMIRVPSVATGIATARAVVRIAGAGHSAAIHSTNSETVMQYAAEVPVLRVAVNVGNSTGSSGLGTKIGRAHA